MSKNKFNPDKPFTLTTGESCRILVKNQKNIYGTEFHIAICEENTPQASIIFIYNDGSVNNIDIADYVHNRKCKNTPEVTYIYQLTSKYDDSFVYNSAQELLNNWYDDGYIKLITEIQLENNIPISVKLVTLDTLKSQFLDC